MFNSETLEVGIGMAFLFLLISLICTAVKEWIEGIFKWRAMDLERALRTLLDDDNGAVTGELLRHPMISSLFQGTYNPAALRSSWLTPGGGTMHVRLRARRNLPSYIPAAQFAAALLDHVVRGPLEAAGTPPARAAEPLTVALLRQRADTLASPYLRRAVLAAIDHSAGDLAQVSQNLQRWFDGSMDRASGWYKRRTQALLFCLGAGIAVVLNVDALHVMERLTADKTFREVVVSAATKAEAPGAAASGVPLDRVREARAQIKEIGFPVGWRPAAQGWLGWAPMQLCAEPPAGAAAAGSACTLAEQSVFSWVRTLLGWLITAFAVMLGAPFWFDVLNKFMVIRSTVKPREKSREEGSEDRPLGAAEVNTAPTAAPPHSAPPP